MEKLILNNEEHFAVPPEINHGAHSDYAEPGSRKANGLSGENGIQAKKEWYAKLSEEEREALWNAGDVEAISWLMEIDLKTQAWLDGLSEEERLLARAEARAYEALSEAECDAIWNGRKNSIVPASHPATPAGDSFAFIENAEARAWLEKWWNGLSAEDKVEARKEADWYESLSAAERDAVWNAGDAESAKWLDEEEDEAEDEADEIEFSAVRSAVG